MRSRTKGDNINKAPIDVAIKSLVSATPSPCLSNNSFIAPTDDPIKKPAIIEPVDKNIAFDTLAPTKKWSCLSF